MLHPLVIKNARGIQLYLEDAILVKEPMAFKVRPGTFLNCVYYGACVLCPLIIKMQVARYLMALPIMTPLVVPGG